MTRRNRNTHARLAAWLLGAVLATAPTLALAHGPEAKAVKARLAPLSATPSATVRELSTRLVAQHHYQASAMMLFVLVTSVVRAVLVVFTP